MRIAYYYSLFDNYRLILYYQAVKNGCKLKVGVPG